MENNEGRTTVPGAQGRGQSLKTTSSEYKLPLYRKLLLTSIMCGNDICGSFNQLYEVALLQILGVPVTFVSLSPIVSGPVAIGLVNLLGYLSDRGTQHRRKKMAGLGIVSALMLLALVVIITANLLLLSNGGSNSATGRNDSLSANCNTSTAEAEYFENQTEYAPDMLPLSQYDQFDVDCILPAVNGSTAMIEDAVTLFTMPLTAVLGIVGFCLLDIGYDVNIAVTRSCVLACSPSIDHTSILVLALVNAALGGCINYGIGLVDIAGLVGDTTGNSLVVQMTVQLGVCGFMLVMCSTSTLVTAHFNNKSLHDSSCLLPDGHDTHEDDVQRYGTFDLDGKRNKNGAKAHVIAKRKDDFSDEMMLLEEDSIASSSDNSENSGTVTEPWEDDAISETGDWFNRSLSVPLKTSDSHRHVTVIQGTELSCNKARSNFIITCVSFYLGVSVIFSYTMYTADFLGKVVMGGDSNAAKGSAELEAYEEGVATAAGGLLLFVCCFLVMSALHSKLIKFWGLKVDFCLAHILMATAILALTLSENVTVYYVASVFYCFQRSAVLSVPFIVASNYVGSQKLSMKSSSMGKMMGIMSCMVPLNFCTLYLMSGPLITLTQYDGAPLVLASVCSGLAALVFLLYKP